MERGYDGLAIYLEQIRRIPRITEEEWKKYLPKAKQGDVNARNKLLEGNLRLVPYFVAKLGVPEKAVLDLIQKINIRLMNALLPYEPNKGKFSTYVYSIVYNERNRKNYHPEEILCDGKTLESLDIREGCDATKKSVMEHSLETLLSCLSEAEKSLINAKIFEGKSFIFATGGTAEGEISMRSKPRSFAS